MCNDKEISFILFCSRKSYLLFSSLCSYMNLIINGLLALLKKPVFGKEGKLLPHYESCSSIGSSCHLKGSHQVVSCIKKLIEKYDLDDRIELSGTFCMGNCQNDVCVSVDGEIFSVIPEETTKFFENNILKKVLN